MTQQVSSPDDLITQMLASVMQHQRRVIGLRTREGMAARKAEGVRMGRPPILSEDVVGRIVAEHGAGVSMRRIARQLNEEGVATAHGGSQWYASTVSCVLKSTAAQRLGKGGESVDSAA